MRRYTITVNGRNFEVELLERSATAVSFSVTGKRYDVQLVPRLEHRPDDAKTHPDDPPRPTRRSSSLAASSASKTSASASPQTQSPKQIIAPMPGVVVSVGVTPGSTVAAGTSLLVIEAMKMENSITAPRAGTVKSVAVSVGQEIDARQLLVEFE